MTTTLISPLDPKNAFSYTSDAGATSTIKSVFVGLTYTMKTDASQNPIETPVELIAVIRQKNNKVFDKKNVIYFNNQTDYFNHVTHLGDDNAVTNTYAYTDTNSKDLTGKTTKTITLATSKSKDADSTKRDISNYCDESHNEAIIINLSGLLGTSKYLLDNTQPKTIENLIYYTNMVKTINEIHGTKGCFISNFINPRPITKTPEGVYTIRKIYNIKEVPSISISTEKDAETGISSNTYTVTSTITMTNVNNKSDTVANIPCYISPVSQITPPLKSLPNIFNVNTYGTITETLIEAPVTIDFYIYVYQSPKNTATTNYTLNSAIDDYSLTFYNFDLYKKEDTIKHITRNTLNGFDAPFKITVDTDTLNSKNPPIMQHIGSIESVADDDQIHRSWYIKAHLTEMSMTLEQLLESVEPIGQLQ